MPLRVLDEAEQSLLSYRLSPEEWDALRAKREHLRFPCCDSAVILKTSSLGLQFFAHHRRGDCISGPETADHLAIKALIADSAETAGWKAETEHPGQTPDGERWIADVLCSREGRDGALRIAFEVQWSGQRDEDFVARQERYRRSGIRCIWFKRMSESNSYSGSNEFPIRQSLPMFALIKREEEYRLPHFGNERIQDVVPNILRGRLRFWPRRDAPARIELHESEFVCRGCGAVSNNAAVLRYTELIAGGEGVSCDLTPDDNELFYDSVQHYFGNPRRFGLGGFWKRWMRLFPLSNINRFSKERLANCCSHCHKGLVTEPYWLGAPEKTALVTRTEVDSLPAVPPGRWYYLGKQVPETLPPTRRESASSS